MADGMSLQVEGLKELEKKLLAMGPKLARNGLRAAVGAGARVIRDEAKARVPVDSGVMRRSIYIKQIREMSGNSQQTFFVGVRSGKKYRRKNQDAYYWRWVEFGYNAKNGRFIPAQPFMRQAFEGRKVAASDAIKQKLVERVEAFAKENT
jgi:HK97 gp10 family phage protein